MRENNIVKDFHIIFTEELNACQSKALWELLVMADKEFVPPLSARNSTTQKGLSHLQESDSELPTAYYDTLQEQNFLLAMEQGRVIGFLSYRPKHRVELPTDNSIVADYVSTIIVHPECRGRGITEMLYGELLAQSESSNIVTRTWSTNDAHLHILEKLEFQNICILQDDRGQGIDTVYYRRTNKVDMHYSSQCAHR